MLFDLPNAGYICRRCAHRLSRSFPPPANRPQCRPITLSASIRKSRGALLTFRKTRVALEKKFDKEKIVSNHVPRKVAMGPLPRILNVPTDVATPEKPEPERLDPAKRPYNPLEHFNWYWQTFPPDVKQTVRANRFFTSNQNPPRLLTSAARFMQVPDSDVPEVAFVGRSNVGKSSLLNAIVDANVNELLARTSKTPGFTKTMNFYGIGPGFGVKLEKGDNGRDKIVGTGGLVIVDMPGYGEGSLAQWGVEIMKYIQSRKQLRRVFVLIDAEHGIKDKDRSLLASLRLAGVSHQVIMSKMDKIYVPKAKQDRDIKHFHSNKKSFAMKPKGTVEALRQEMEKLRPDINPPHGAGALGELLACSSEVVVNGKRLGLDHVRFAVLKAVGLEVGTRRAAKKLATHLEIEEELEGKSVKDKVRAPGLGTSLSMRNPRRKWYVFPSSNWDGATKLDRPGAKE